MGCRAMGALSASHRVIQSRLNSTERILTYLSTTQDLVAGEVEDVEDELRHRIPTDPQEERLPVLDEEETMALESF